MNPNSQPQRASVPEGNGQVASISMEALVKEHNVLVAVVTENVSLRAQLAQYQQFVGQLEAELAALKGEAIGAEDALPG